MKVFLFCKDFMYIIPLALLSIGIFLNWNYFFDIIYYLNILCLMIYLFNILVERRKISLQIKNMYGNKAKIYPLIYPVSVSLIFAYGRGAPEHYKLLIGLYILVFITLISLLFINPKKY